MNFDSSTISARGRCLPWLAALLLIANVRAGNPDDPPRVITIEIPTVLQYDLKDADIVGADIVDLYDAAVATLEKTCDDYRRIKAIELSLTRRLPFREAYENVNSVMPLLPPVDKVLLRRPIRDPNHIVPHKREVENVQSQIESMIELTAKLLDEIERIQMAIEHHIEELDETLIRLEEIVARPDFDPDLELLPEIEPPDAGADASFMAQLEAFALDADDNRYRDLTPLMHAVMPDSAPPPPPPPPPPPSADAAADDAADVPPPPETAPHTAAGDVLADLIDRAPSASPEMRAQLESITQLATDDFIYGRAVADGGAPVEWMFIDTWYTIGPFPNPSRANINRRFPPETVIDLDATYIGKGGREVHWEFLQSGRKIVTPAEPEEYAIWYAYTELYLDRAMDLWVAIGSDDKGNIWVNDIPIWVSSDELKSWRVNEGFRKVAFRAGVNRILYRIENGWHAVHFSLAIHVAEGAIH